MDVGLGELLGDHPQLVGEADLHGDIAVHRDLGQLGADDRHAGDTGRIGVVSLIEPLQRRAAVWVRFADQHHVRLEQAFDDVAQRDELRIVHTNM